jgi:polyhydroxybutyrate depolymerase
MAEKKSINKIIRLIVLGLIIIFIIGLSTQFKTNGRIISSAKARKYLLYIPDSYDPARATPLVISIHGFVQWPAHQQSMTGWNKLADEHGFLVVYPQGTGFPLRWNTGPSSDGTASTNQDLRFISDLIDHLAQTYNIDPGRIYANGMSNGGGMSDLLACDLSQKIAAIGGVAGAYLYPGEDCHPAHPMPVIAFHGVEDAIVPYFGGPSRDDRFEFLPVEDWAANWADLNTCTDSPQTAQITNEISRISYHGCEESGEVVFYRINDGGHTWPGGEKLPVWIAGYTNPDINATALMWDFFSTHSLQSNE